MQNINNQQKINENQSVVVSMEQQSIKELSGLSERKVQECLGGGEQERKG